MFFWSVSEKVMKNRKSNKPTSLCGDMADKCPLRTATEVNKLLWYPFNTLVDSHDGTAHISTLKVLISSLGRVMGFQKSEELLNIDGKTNIDFPLFCDIIDNEFLKIKNSASPSDSSEDPYELYRLCWNIYHDHHFTKSEFNLYKTSEQNLFKIWMIFILLSEDNENNVPDGAPKIDREEIGILFRSFVSISGLTALEDKIQEIETGPESLKFIDFKDLFIGLFGSQLSETDLEYYLSKIFELYIDDIFQKGMLCKRGYQVKHWKDRWFVLRKNTLKYYTNTQEKEMKGCINIVKDCRIEVVSDGTKSGTKSNRFIIHTNSKPYECSAADTRTRTEWVTALNLAISKCEDPNFHYHKNQSKQRQAKRREKRKREEEEAKRKLEDEETLRRLQEEYSERHKQDELRLREQMEALEAEKLAREDLESRLLKEAALREVEKRRLREVEEAKKELQRLLEEERQAKRDEEIVRQLQASLLEEESQKREELERLRKEQEALLQQERQEREGLEGQREEQERLLAEAQSRLEQLEVERQAANAELQEASSKLEKAEKDRIIAEAKMKLWKNPTIGLARPVLYKHTPLTTHRGEGAFCEIDFHKKDLRKNQLTGNKEEMTTAENGGNKKSEDNDVDDDKSEEKLPVVSAEHGGNKKSEDNDVDDDKNEEGTKTEAADVDNPIQDDRVEGDTTEDRGKSGEEDLGKSGEEDRGKSGEEEESKNPAITLENHTKHSADDTLERELLIIE
uniref:Switch-associated protein 70-like isoform X2 n=1 Tax=Crassostrea virginica TaxID=6565 RepID=A0A8B8ELD9_CRAVI|nr:switch-associated protein 70-like isoform X2 [Crassostrea virginica]